MTLALRATNDGGGVILLNGSPKITLDAAGNILGTLTPALGDSTQKLANTEFTNRVMGSLRGRVAVTTATALSAAQVGFMVQLAAASSQATLPLASSVPAGSAYHLINTWSAANSVAKQGSDQLYNGGTVETSLSLGANESAKVVSDGIAAWYVIGGTELLKKANMFGSLKAGSGWQKLPGGLILQWASVLSTATGFAPVTWPITFPSQCLETFMTPFVGSGAINFTLTQSGSPTVSSANCSCWVGGVQSSIAGQVGVRWMAIGY